MAKTKKLRVLKLPVPKNHDEVNDYITRLAEAKNAAKALVNKANAQMAEIQDQLADQLIPLETELKRVSHALFAYWERNQDELTDHGRRQSFNFATGALGQRLHPTRTQFEDEDSIKDFVIRHHMYQFYETKTVLRRDVMLANQDLAAIIPGVSFVQDRTVYVKPDEFDVEIDLGKRVMAA